MAIITQDLLSEILYCPKIAVRADRKKMLSANRNKKNNAYLVSEDGKYEYKLFLRQSLEFLEDFSVGLIWTNPTKIISITKSSVILLRCQGPHDGRAAFGSDVHHNYHIHMITLEDFESRRYQKPSGRTATSDFSSFEQAISYAIGKHHINNLDGVLDLPEEVTQTTLF